jgi:outer membrane protein OmpA-like peptidoglycan-associated protein
LSLKKLLLATTSLCALSLFPLAAHAQDAALSAAYEAYVSASSGTDADAKTAAETAFLIECTRVGQPVLADCIALVTSGAVVETPAEPVEQPAAEPATEASPVQPADPAADAPAEAAPAEPAAEQPDAEPTQTPSSDPALIAAYESYVAASSGTDDTAKVTAEATFLAECNRLGIASLDECLAMFSAAGEVTAAPQTEAGAEPVEVIPNQEATDAAVAPVLDSAKEADGQSPTDQSAAEQPPAPTSDAEAQAEATPVPEADVTATVEAEGTPIETLSIEPPQDMQVVTQTQDNRFVFSMGINLTIFTPYDDRDRIVRDGDEVTYHALENGRVRQTVIRADGTRVITVWNRSGEIIRRVKVRPDGTRILMIFDRDDRDGRWRDPGDDLPPFRLTIPVGEYVLYSEIAGENEIQLFLSEPPLEQAVRVYSVDEVKRSARLRDTVRRVEIGDLTFDTGEATVERDQVGSLTKVANALLQLIERNPGEVFLIEGHTDAVGSDESNLELSDRRAETVATLLTDLYDVPPENLVTQGYGERYLKVDTDDAERVNRRATVRRITPLVAPVAGQ